MKIIIPGGSGQVGSMLARAFHKIGHQVVVLSRTPDNPPWKVVEWDARSLGVWVREFCGAEVVINLAGRNVNCRYSKSNRQLIYDSRVRSTRVVGRAISQAKNPPRVWLQASTATLYAHRYDADNDEKTGIIGGNEPETPDAWRFSIQVAQAWERELDDALTPATRKVKLRSAMTMSPDRGGIFDTLLGLVRHGLGGTSGNGRQYLSWVHEVDFVGAIEWLMEHDQVDGTVNIAAPNPLPNAEFMQILRQAWGAKFGLPAANWMLALGAFFLRTETELVLKSRRVIPGRLQEEGFVFEYPSWKLAAEDLCQRWRDLHRSGE